MSNNFHEKNQLWSIKLSAELKICGPTKPVVGKLLLLSSGVTLLPLLVKKILDF
jgi:hypothetical protein